MKKQEALTPLERGMDYGQAIAEADRCLLCHEPPCSAACPAQTDPGAFIRKLRLRNVTGAVRTIEQNNALGGACALLCPAERLCEQHCSSCGIDRPIAIAKLQRFLVEHGWERGLKLSDPAPARPERLAIVGSGPAGLSCAAELARKGFQVTVFEERAEPGGAIRFGVPEHRFPKAFLDRELAGIRELGVRFECGKRIEGRSGVQELLEQGFAAVFLAPGLWRASCLGFGEGIRQGLQGSVAFLEALRGEGLAAVRAQVEGRVVAVVGGGSVAIDCAESALRLGARDVYLVYRRSYLQMPAEQAERAAAQQAGVHFLLLNQPVGYRAGADGKLTAIALVRTRLGEPDGSGRRAPVEVPGSQWELQADLVIEAIGNLPAADSPEWYPGVQLGKGDLVVADPQTGATRVAGLFAGGDIVRGPALVVEAVRDGKAAAKGIEQYLAKQGERR